jgi:hypothetical protein
VPEEYLRDFLLQCLCLYWLQNKLS